MILESESTFRLRLSSILSGAYRCRVWHSHAEDGMPRFQIVGVKLGCPDLYVVPPPSTRLRERFERIAIEAKAELDMSKLFSGITQAIRYIEELATARYVIEGINVPSPRIVLLATPDSVEHGEVYRWRGHPGSDLPDDEPGKQSYWRGMTLVIERFLIGQGASLLRWHKNGGLYFRSNRTPSGAVETFFLDAPSTYIRRPRPI